MPQVIEWKIITEKKYGQSMQNMLNEYNVNMWTFVQLKTQINELEKVQQNNENKTKLEKLKERLSKEEKKLDIQPWDRTVLTWSKCETLSHI